MGFGLGLTTGEHEKHHTPWFAPKDNPEQRRLLQTFASSYQQLSQSVGYLKVK